MAWQAVGTRTMAARKEVGGRVLNSLVGSRFQAIPTSCHLTLPCRGQKRAGLSVRLPGSSRPPGNLACSSDYVGAVCWMRLLDVDVPAPLELFRWAI